MTPELEYLLARCGYPSQVEEYVNDILSMSPDQLTERLNKALRDVQKESTFFPRMERGRWYIVTPPTPADPPRCILGETFINAVITFPDLESPPASCPKKERGEFEKLYARTFMEKLQLVHNYAIALARVHELSEVSGEMLEHARDLLHLSIWHAKRDRNTSDSQERKSELSYHIDTMTTCLFALAAERRRRHEEKGSS